MNGDTGMERGSWFMSIMFLFKRMSRDSFDNDGSCC